MTDGFRYDLSGKWFKGNVHLHTNVSDGRQTPQEAAAAYAAAGYDFIALTDHNVASDASTMESKWPLLVIDGVEINGTDLAGTDYHAACLGTFRGLPVESGFVAMLESLRAQDGVLILAHPRLMYHSADEVLRYRFDGVEVYNQLGAPRGRPDGEYHWDVMLEHDPDTLAFAVDDAHQCGDDLDAEPGTTSWRGGWIVVNAPERTQGALLAAIKTGNFYSSCGPSIHSIDLADGKVVLHTSPVRRAWLLGSGWVGSCVVRPDYSPFTEASFDLPESTGLIRIQIEDERGRKAWTNTLFAAHAD